MPGRGRGRGGRGGRGSGGGPLSGGRALLQRSAKEAGLGSLGMKRLEDITRPALFPDYEWHSNGGMQQQIITSMDDDNDHDNGNNADGNPMAVATRPPIITSTHKPNENKQRPQTQASKNFLINKGRSLQDRFQQSAYFLQASVEVDVERYNPHDDITVGNNNNNNKRKRSYGETPISPDDAAVASVLEFTGMSEMDEHHLQDYLPKELWSNNKDSMGVGGGGSGAGAIAALDTLAAAEKNALAEDAEGGGDNIHDLEAGEEEEEEDADYATNYYASDDEAGDDGNDDEAVF